MSNTPTPEKRGFAKKKSLLKSIKDKTNKHVAQMLAAKAADMGSEIISKELERASIAGEMIAGVMEPAPTAAKLNSVTSHPDLKKIETELILSRGADIEGMCVRWKIFEKDGSLAVANLTRYYGSMRRRYSRLFDTLDLAAKEKMASSYLAKVDEIYNLAKNGQKMAMEIKKATDYGLIEDPNFEAGNMMLDKMLAATSLIGAAMERQDKKEVSQNGNSAGSSTQNTPMQINGPVGKIQILGLPKAIKKQEDGGNLKQLPPAGLTT